LYGVYLFFLILAVMNVRAEDIKGRVVDALHDEPLIGVNVVVENSGLGTITNNDGEFSLDLPEGDQKLILSYVGYASLEVAIPADRTDPLDLGILQMELGIELATYYFTAYVPDNFNKKYHGSNTTISFESLSLQKPLGTEEALKTLPGVVVSGDMGISNRLNVGIRGSYPRRAEKILLMEDGTPIAPAPYLSPSAYYNPPTERLDGIEVIKGADILQFGGNTMHGAVNYITRKPPAVPQLNINLAAGDHGMNSQYVTYGGTWDNLSSEIQLLHKHFGGFQDNTDSRIFNVTAKILGQLDERNSMYLKLNFHHEDSKATYSGLTPLSFDLDPTQNPFDADDLLTNRYAIDLAHTFDHKGLTVASKLFAHQFSRDWWRQDNTVIAANDAASYLGEDILSDRYGYLEGLTFGEDDYVRVGKITDGQESVKARNRIFRVAGIQERLEFVHDFDNGLHVDLSGGLDYHVESFGNQEITNGTSRFSRSGEIVKDESYLLHAVGGFLKTSLTWSGLSAEPILRYEWIKMSKLNELAVANDPDNTGDKDYGKTFNSFSSFIPGINLSYELTRGSNQAGIFAGVYKGFTPPTSGFGFLTVDEGEVSPPDEDELVNIRSETSINFDLGVRTNVKSFSGQLSYFNDHIRNFYAAGRKEAFQSLGSVRIQGLELNFDLEIMELTNVRSHHLDLGGSLTWLNSEITGGTLLDTDLLKAKHNDATRAELIDKINAQRSGYVVYAGDEVLEGALTIDDFDDITMVEMSFGEGGITGNSAPYNPDIVLSARLRYSFRDVLNLGLQLNYVGSQYTEYLNFNSETSEGAIGKLDAFTTLDLNAGYSIDINRKDKSKVTPRIELYFAAKNITGRIYKASRLHRVSSGIMPGGFRHFQGGVKVRI
jgi:Fe(3+) dicitrate transport protein